MQLSATTKPESGGLTADGSTKRVLVAKEEYIRLRWAAAYWKAQHAGAVEREKQLKSENLSLRARVRELESQLWGRKSEQAKGGRAGSSSPKASGRPRGQQKGKQGHGRTTLDGLAAQEEVVDLEEAQKSCPKCGLALEALGWTEDAEVAEIEVRAHRRVIRRRKYKAACRCGVLPGIVTAPAPARLIPKGKLGISVWVEILLEKFDHCRPTHRLLQQWRDHGLTLSAGTVAGGLKNCRVCFCRWPRRSPSSSSPRRTGKPTRPAGRCLWRWKAKADGSGICGCFCRPPQSCTSSNPVARLQCLNLTSAAPRALYSPIDILPIRR